MRIRGARPDDAEALAAMWNVMIRETLFTFTTEEKSPGGIAAMIKDRPGAFWVADAPEPVGFVTYGQFRAGPGYAASVEHSIVLTQSAQGHGIGRALMTKAFGSAAQQGRHVMMAAISGAYPGAVAFHSALGFLPVGRLPEVGLKHDQWIGLILMQKMLSGR